MRPRTRPTPLALQLALIASLAGFASSRLGKEGQWVSAYDAQASAVHGGRRLAAAVLPASAADAGTLPPPQLSARQLNALLHRSFRQPRLDGRGGGRRLLQASDPAAGAEAAPAYGGLFVVTATGVSLQTNASAPGVSAAVSSVANVVSTLQSKFALANSTSLQPLWNALFWSACAFAGVLVLHVALRGAVVWRRSRMPGWLEFPNPELVLLSALLPIVAAAGAGFIRADQPGQQAAGIIFAVVLPGIYMLFTVWLVLRFLVNSDPTKRAAVYVVSAKEHEQQQEQEVQPVEAGAGASVEAESGTAGTSATDPGIARVSAGSAGTAASAGSSQQGGRRSLLRRGNDSGTGGGGDSRPGAPSHFRRARTWLARFVSRTLLGYRPHEMDGEWVSTAPGSAFAERYGAVFECKGPLVRHVPGTYEWRDDGGGLDRGRMVPVEDPTRARRARQTLQALGTTMITLRLVLFADILAGMSQGVSPLVPIILLLVVTVLYCLFLRFIAPPHNMLELAVEAVLLLCNLGNIVCGIMIAVTPPAKFETTTALGWAMLAFQLAGMVASILPQLCRTSVLLFQLIVRLVKGKTPADKFADAVQGAMRQDPGILVMKFGDRWMVKALRRGLQGRAVLHHEHSGHAVLPLPASVGRQLRRAPTLLRRRDRGGDESMLRRSSTMAASTS